MLPNAMFLKLVAPYDGVTQEKNTLYFFRPILVPFNDTSPDIDNLNDLAFSVLSDALVGLKPVQTMKTET